MVIKLHIDETLTALRKEAGLTQGEVAQHLHTSFQTISKWERGEYYPDIGSLVGLARLFNTSVDELIGMDRVEEDFEKAKVISTAHSHLLCEDMKAAIDDYRKALRVFPHDVDLLSNLAIALALDGGSEELGEAVRLCEGILTGSEYDKVHHTTRAALCFIYLKAGQKENADKEAKKLPCLRESYEVIREQIDSCLSDDEINSHLSFIATGWSGAQEMASEVIRDNLEGYSIEKSRGDSSIITLVNDDTNDRFTVKLFHNDIARNESDGNDCVKFSVRFMVDLRVNPKYLFFSVADLTGNPDYIIFNIEEFFKYSIERRHNTECIEQQLSFCVQDGRVFDLDGTAREDVTEYLNRWGVIGS